MVNEIIIPSHIPKLLFAKKCFMVKKIIVRDAVRGGAESENVPDSVDNQ